MNDIELNKDYLRNTFGLSCVENLVMYILKANNIEYQKLFYNSFLTFSEIENSFINYNQTYSVFNEIPRLQNIAIQEGIIDVELINSNDIPVSNSNQYMLLMVAPVFEKDKYRKELWRDDHFVLLTSCDKKLYYINDNPIDISVISINDISKYYSGQAILISMNKVELKGASFYLHELLDSIHIDTTYCESFYDIAVLRDIVGVLKISRKRMYALVSLSQDAEFMIPYVKFLEHIYSLLEYMRIKDQYNHKKILAFKNEIVNKDKEILAKLLDKHSIS